MKLIGCSIQKLHFFKIVVASPLKKTDFLCKPVLSLRTAANASVDRRQSRIFTPSYDGTHKVIEQLVAANASHGPVQCTGASLLYTGSTV